MRNLLSFLLIGSAFSSELAEQAQSDYVPSRPQGNQLNIMHGYCDLFLNRGDKFFLEGRMEEGIELAKRLAETSSQSSDPLQQARNMALET